MERVPIRRAFPSSGQFQKLHTEVGAADQALQRAARHGGHGKRARNGEARRAKAHDVKRLGHVERTGFPVRPCPAVIEDAVREVGALLRLGDQDSASDGVNRARGDEEAIAPLDLYPAKRFGQGSVPDAALHLLPRDLPVKPHIEERPGLVIQDEPHLRLARTVLDAGGVGVVRVNLDGERKAGVDELHQQGKRRANPVAAGHDLRVRPHDLRERTSRPRAVRDDAVPGGVGGQFPALRDRFEVGSHSPLLLQARAAPEVILQGGNQRKRLHKKRPPHAGNAKASPTILDAHYLSTLTPFSHRKQAGDASGA